MEIKNTDRNFTKASPRDFVSKFLIGRGCTDFQKIDLKRPRQINAEILRLFDQFINSPNVDTALKWYEKEGHILYLFKDLKTNSLKFYGCNKNIDHHNSNIEWIIKYILHKMLHANGGRKILVDQHALSLVGFGILPLYQKEESGNNYQGFNTTYSCNIGSLQVSLNKEQIELARKILRLIAGK